MNRPEGIWYTPVSGIWQTVWLEAVPQQYIKQVKTTPDLDRKSFRIEVPVCGAQPEDRIEVALFDGDQGQLAQRRRRGTVRRRAQTLEPRVTVPLRHEGKPGTQRQENRRSGKLHGHA